MLSAPPPVVAIPGELAVSAASPSRRSPSDRRPFPKRPGPLRPVLPVRPLLRQAPTGRRSARPPLKPRPARPPLHRRPLLPVPGCGRRCPPPCWGMGGAAAASSLRDAGTASSSSPLLHAGAATFLPVGDGAPPASKRARRHPLLQTARRRHPLPSPRNRARAGFPRPPGTHLRVHGCARGHGIPADSGFGHDFVPVAGGGRGYGHGCWVAGTGI